MRNFFKNLFKKQTSQNVTIDLSRWNKFLSEPYGYINSVVNQNHINDVAAALIYTDKKTKQRFFESAEFLGITNKLKNAMVKNQNLSKYESDKAKLVLLSTFEAKGLTLLPGFRHL